MSADLLTRDEFRAAVFARDRHTCVCCSQPAADAHHLIDRCLWENGGYHIDNGVSLCAEHHLQAEQTLISCTDLRLRANITAVRIPEHFFSDEVYDHWGNIILPSGERIKGELFGQPNVQKILTESGLLNRFLEYVKFPRTYHTPWSPNLQNDDRRHNNVDFFIGKQVVVTCKMDGENTSMYPDHIHARSIDSKHHESRSLVKALHGRIKHEIPKGWRITGENLYAKHSIFYKALKDYFQVFFIWNENNTALSWADTVEYCQILDLATVPVLGQWTYESHDKARETIENSIEEYKKETGEDVEGYVIRTAGEIAYKDYRRCTAKCVRKGHVQTSQFWMSQQIIPNQLLKV